MGHYHSEMNGGPDMSSIIIRGKIADEIGLKILKSKRLKYKKIEHLEIKWKNPYGYHHDIWVNISYLGNKHSSSVSGYDFHKTLSFASGTQRHIIKNRLSAEKVSI